MRDRNESGWELAALPTALEIPPDCPTVRLSDCPTVRLSDCPTVYFLIVAPVSSATAPSVVCAALRPSMKSLSLYVV